MTDNRLREGAEALTMWAERFKAVMDLADAIKEAGSLENAIAERKAQIALLNVEHSDTQAKLADAQAEWDRLAQIQAAVLDAQRQTADALLGAAHEQEQAIIASAKANAQQLIDDANTQAAKLEAAHTARLNTSRAELTGLLLKKQTAENDVVRATEQHNILAQKMAALRDSARSLSAGE